MFKWRSSVLGFVSATLISGLSLAQSGEAETMKWNVQVEAAAAWQTLNDQAVPGDGGTRIALTDFGKGPFPAYRIYFGGRIDERREWRVLYAPFEVHLSGSLGKDVNYQGRTFQKGVATDAKYKFNSYRFTYAYNMDPVNDWTWSLGFTGKIRDAEVKLSQGGVSESKSNVGFVPLLHINAAKELGSEWKFKFDMDGLMAPQGRAFDIALFFERKLEAPGRHFLAGYRMVEGGADNDAVYNFAWFHYLTVGIKQDF